MTLYKLSASKPQYMFTSYTVYSWWMLTGDYNVNIFGEKGVTILIYSKITSTYLFLYASTALFYKIKHIFAKKYTVLMRMYIYLKRCLEDLCYHLAVPVLTT